MLAVTDLGGGMVRKESRGRRDWTSLNGGLLYEGGRVETLVNTPLLIWPLRRLCDLAAPFRACSELLYCGVVIPALPGQVHIVLGSVQTETNSH